MGRSHLLFTQANHGLANIRLPWFNGLSFRTRQHAPAVLLTIEIGGTARNDQPYEIIIRLVNGTVVYSHPMQTVTFEAFSVNDGEWHYLETRWLPGELLITLDYGHFQKSSRIGDWIVGQTVGQIVVGRRLTEDGNNEGFVGCVKAVRVGSSPGILLSKPETIDAELGCESEKSCDVLDVCPQDRSTCIERWNSHECLCSPGRIGSDCKKICDSYNPCRNGATCIESLSSSKKYSCHCDQYHNGEHCELVVNTTCPSTWWGSPICGPCNCPKQKGFDSRCNKITGECYCRENHYRQDELCIPCNCYEIGSIGRSCDRSAGQCLCRKGVTGRRCDSCHSRFAEVTLRGCEVVYDACPRAYSDQIWWRRTRFLETVYEDCPEGSVGAASRFCNETEGWKEPDLSNCTSLSFLELGQQLKLIERQDLKMSTFLVKGLLSRLEVATRETAAMRRMDVIIAYRLIIHILNYESRQTGLNLSHTQDRNFIQYLANCLSRILDPVYLIEWMRLNEESNASISLLKSLEMYSITLASNMLVTFTQPMDAVNNNIVIGLDFLASNNLSHVVIPKYNNKVQSSAMFDKTTKSLLPAKIFTSVNDWRNGSLVFGRHIPTISYVLFRTLGDLLPHRYEDSVGQTASAPVVVNSPLFMLNIFNGDKMIEGEQLSEPIRIQFLPLVPNNHSNALCVHWSQAQHSTGMWSTEGCQMSPRHFGEQSVVECHCDHLSTFGVLMEARSAQALLNSTYRPDLSMWVCAVVAIVCFAVTIVILCILLRTGTNLITIHLNLMVVLLLADATFVAGIDRTEPKIVCRLIAILLQYFLMSSFTWVFVKSLHLYRLITSIVDVSRGPMHFYCAIGYVVPGIITGLSVGLSTDSYGNQVYCWLKLHDVIFLTFAGSVIFVMLISVILFAVSLGTACRGLPKHSTTDRNYMKYEIGAGSILLILMALGLFFGVLSLHEAVPAFQYLFSGFTCLQGVFALTIYVILNKEVKSQLNYIRYSKKEDSRLPSYSRTHSLGSASFYGSASRNPVSLASNNTLYKPTANNPIVLNSEVESYAPHPNTGHPLYGTSTKAISQQKQQSIPLTNISRAKTNDRVSNYSDSDNSDTQNHEGGELASSHSSDEDCESYNQPQKA